MAYLSSMREWVGRGMRLAAGAKFEGLLVVLLLLTAGAVVWQDQILDRTLIFTPKTAEANDRIVLADSDNGGTTAVRETGPLSWSCDLRDGMAYPYCGYELFFDRGKGTHGLDLTNMHALGMTLVYHGASTTFRVHLKNFDPRYSRSPNDDTPKFLRVEAATTPGKVQHVEFVPADFGVADWWLQKFQLAPEFGHPQFDNVTSMNIETGSQAPLGHHDFEIREIVIHRAALSQAAWYSLLLGVWGVMIVIYLGYRISNLRRTSEERRKLQALALREAREAACHDPLTRILNRRGLMERFEELLRDRKDPMAATVILIDLDHFKRLNDTHGHDCGDKVLAEVAQVISQNIRSADIAARWGGEEFIVVCNGIDRKGAQHIAEKLRERIARTDFGACGQVTASFGIHWAYAMTPDLPSLVAYADVALYAAKAAGRNCCRMHRIGMSKAA